ncbi:DUF6624 domain-containing protein [Leptolyngbya ohadii]|uniref:DUF6624 domain-containing protein n=1 Tax=Leptolyngbya ohadii TaxID=1962290 RepID=UPI0019D4CB16|nr:DUF6624 domain-containing protein [Leptolyngbya ohadii]
MNTQENPSDPQPMYASLANELLQMEERDQAMRNSQQWDESVDIQNTARLKQIIQEIGWPSISKVGRWAANAAWLLAQHADRDVDFQRECLDRMKQQIDDVDIKTVAYLEDRVRVNEGRSQLYGTQYHLDEQGNLVPQPIENPEEVDDRRKAVGLEPLAEYDQIMRQLHQEMEQNS